MKKISDNFCGYLKVGDDKCAYSVSNNIVTLLPAQNEETEIDEAFERLRSRKTELPEYLLGEDYDGLIAIIRNDKFSTRSLGFTPSKTDFANSRFSFPYSLSISSSRFCFSSLPNK